MGFVPNASRRSSCRMPGPAYPSWMTSRLSVMNLDPCHVAVPLVQTFVRLLVFVVYGYSMSINRVVLDALRAVVTIPVRSALMIGS